MNEDLKKEVNEIMIKVLLDNVPITELFNEYSDEATDIAVDMLCECYEFLNDKYELFN